MVNWCMGLLRDRSNFRLSLNCMRLQGIISCASTLLFPCLPLTSFDVSMDAAVFWNYRTPDKKSPVEESNIATKY